MATTFTMPSLGDTPEVPIVTRWLKAVGDFVEVDEPLVEVSTSKVDTELPSPVQGFVKKILVQEDESVAVGGALALIGAADEAFEGFRRSESKVMIAPATNITDEGRYESPDGTRSFAIPRYAIHTEKVGGVEEPRVLIVERAGVSFLSITLAKDPGPASGPGVQELPHTIRVTLAMETPSPTEFELSVASPTDGGTLFAAELPLEVGQREQFVAAFGDIQANVMLVLERKITVAQVTGQHFEDGQEAYVEREVELTAPIPPTPLMLSDRQRARLSGGIAEQTRKVRLDFEGHTHTYWQDANEPAQFAYLPDEFLLARSAEVPLKSQLRAAVHTGGEAPKFVLEFTAQPVTSARRLAAARKALAAKAQELGANEPVTLQPLDDAQPILRLALPVDGVASPKLVAREATRLDMQSGLRHSEVFELEDFRAVFGALNGQSLTLLGGEILVRAGTPDEAEVPLELRLDRAGGEVLKVQAQPLAQPATQVTVTNGIESPVLLDDLHAVAIGANTQLPLAIDQLPAGSRLAPGESCDVRLTFPSAATDPDLSLLVDQIDVVVEPDEKAIWELIFDKHTEERLVRDIQIHALAAMFKDPARPDDEVLEFIVTIENGSSTIIDPSTLDVTTKVRVPVIPLLTGDGSPTFRYRTETHWSSGAIGTSDWREVDSTIIVPVRAAS